METNQTVAASSEVANLQPNIAEVSDKKEDTRYRPVYDPLW